MEKNFLLRKVTFLFLFLILLAPLMHMLFYVSWSSADFDLSILKVSYGAFVQSFVSSILTLSLGFFTSLGLLSVKRNINRSLFRALCFVLIVPSFMPPLVVVLLGAKGLNFLPTGLWGVVFFHVFMNVGVVSYVLYLIIQGKAYPWVRVSQVFGVSPLRFVFKGLFLELRSEFRSLFFYLMVLYFFSFSIPFLVGGNIYGGIEVFIYEKVVLLGRWGEAIQYSLLLFTLVFLISFLLKNINLIQNSTEENGVKEPLSYFKFHWWTVPALFPMALLSWALLKSLAFGPRLQTFHGLWEPVKGTLSVSLLTGLVVFFFLSLLSFCFMNQRFSRLILALVNPGWVIVGFSFLLMPGESREAVFFKVSLGLSILFLPFLFRLSFYQKLSGLRGQVQLAEIFPVSWYKTFFWIIWPQCFSSICFLSGLASLWAAGDFALSGVVTHSATTQTLALEMKALIASYRLEQALALLFPLLLTSLIVFFIFQGLAYVSRRKILS